MARCGCNPTCNCLVEVKDGACLDLSIKGLGTPTNPYILSGEVKVDGTTVKCGASGLQASIEEMDTNTVNLSGDGSAVAPLTADVKFVAANTNELAGTPDGGINLVKAGTTGIYVSCEDIQDCIGAAIGAQIPGTCLVYNDASNKIDVEIDPTAGNAIGCGTGPAGTGLYVTPANIIGDTDNDNCVNVSVTQAPAGTYTIEADLLLDPNACNAATCSGAGLLVPRTTLAANNADEACINVQVTETPGCPDLWNIAAAPVISPDGCNTLECRGDGLFVFGDRTNIPPQQLDCGNFASGVFNGTFTDTPVNGPFCVTLSNPSPCRALVVLGRMSGVVNVSQTDGTMIAGFQVSKTGPGGPWITTAQGGNLSGGAYGTRFTLIWPGDTFVIPVGGSLTLCFRVVASGIGTVNGFIGNSDRCANIIPMSWVE